MSVPLVGTFIGRLWSLRLADPVVVLRDGELIDIAQRWSL